jgi:hypothetical protein
METFPYLALFVVFGCFLDVVLMWRMLYPQLRSLPDRCKKQRRYDDDDYDDDDDEDEEDEDDRRSPRHRARKRNRRRH